MAPEISANTSAHRPPNALRQVVNKVAGDGAVIDLPPMSYQKLFY